MLQLTETQLRAYAEHIDYEVVTMVEQATNARLWTPTDEAVRLALIEATLVHVRLLDEFHRKTPSRRSDDVTAVHYLPAWSPQDILTRRDRSQVNAQLAHLALRRQSGYKWSLVQLAADVSRTFMTFVDQLRKAHPNRATWFDRARRRATGMVAQPQMWVGTGRVPLSVAMTTTTSSSPPVVSRTSGPPNP